MFCILETDTKTYSYFKRYCEFFAEGREGLEIDNLIQAEEMSEHLRTNGFSPKDTQEKLNWIATNGRPFREYLNTIKLVYVLCKVQGIDPSSVGMEQFTELENKLNDLRHCLVSIF